MRLRAALAPTPSRSRLQLRRRVHRREHGRGHMRVDALHSLAVDAREPRQLLLILLRLQLRVHVRADLIGLDSRDDSGAALSLIHI